MPLSRRAAILAVTSAAATLFGRESSQRTMMIPLDGLAGIEVRYQGQTVLVRPDEIMRALSAKEP